LTLPSRTAALGALRRAVEAQTGAVLLTGEAGVGKTWLWRQLRAEGIPPWRWACLDLTPAIDPRGFYRLVGHAIGLSDLDDPSRSRAMLSDFLAEGSDDGAAWVLVVDEAQNVSDDVGEELRVLANRLGSSDGFAAILIVGQSRLARRIATRPLSALGSRLTSWIALKPLELDEAHALVGGLFRDQTWNESALERLHADSGGNPGRILRGVESLRIDRSRPRVEPRPELIKAPPATTAVAAPEPAALLLAGAEPVGEVPVLGPSRPPLREEEGVIEVGWEPTFEGESIAEGVVVDAPIELANDEHEPLTEATEGVETIDDHYAALRAWSEWAKNQGRSTVAGPVENPPGTFGPDDSEGASPPGRTDVATGGPLSSNVWAEGQHGFAPYSQLFSRLRQPRDTN
jgi:general secretion pathway protein A